MAAKFNKHFFVARARHFLRQWFSALVQETIAPFFNRNALLQLISYPFLLYLIFVARGFDAMRDQWTSSWIAERALMYALPLFAAVNAVRAIFIVQAEQQKLGRWEDKRFIFNSPHHLATIVVPAELGDRTWPIKVKNVPVGSYVEVIAVKEGFDTRVSAQISSEANAIPWDGIDRNLALALLYADRTIYLCTRKTQPSNASVIKVQMLSWYGPQHPIPSWVLKRTPPPPWPSK